MPLQGWTCPPYVPTAGNQNELSHCLSTCPHQCVSPLLLNAMWRAESTNHHKGAYISASMLAGSGCARKTWLQRYTPYYEIPERVYWPFRGTIIHTVIEEAGVEHMLQYGWLQELRMAVPLKFPGLPAPVFGEDGAWTGDFNEDEDLVITIGGTTDCYNCITEELHDFKSMADAKTEMLLKAETIDEKWVAQLNIYRWLVSQTKTPARAKKQFPNMPKLLPAPTKLVIQGIGMMATPKTGGTYGMKVSVPGEKWKRYKEADIPAVPVWPLEDTEAFVREKAMDWYKWLVLKEKPPVVDKSMDWLCKVCCFNGSLVEGGTCFPKRERERDTLNEIYKP